MFGHAQREILGQDFSLFFTPEDIQAGVPGKLLQQADHDVRSTDQGWQVRKDGTRFFAEGLLTALGRGASREFGRQTNDVTERRNNEEALLQTQKLESIGVLASGIAHDFNNLLSTIMCGLSFAIANLTPDHPSYQSLVLAERSSEKAADLTHQLLAYAGGGKFVITRFDLSALIADVLTLLQTSIPKHVTLQLALAPDLPWVEGDASQIQQIVMNLVINGAESISSEGGSLWVSTGVTPTEKRASSGIAIVVATASVGAVGEVFMEVRDSGSGMTEDTKARIFDPFFTTKVTGRGLGLAAVLGIVREHEGRMQVESAIGKGSTFRICFPGVERPVQPAERPAVPRNGNGSGTVLVVDDERSLRTMAQTILERSGYKVLVAGDGREAVEVFRQHADTITVILLDMTRPVMSGVEAFRRLRAIRADVPIVVSTGYSEVATRELFGAGAKVGFVQKPYTAARLADRIWTASQAA